MVQSPSCDHSGGELVGGKKFAIGHSPCSVERSGAKNGSHRVGAKHNGHVRAIMPA